MAKIGLTEGFTLIPEGTHVFQITGVNYKEDFGKMEVTMQLASGQKHTERFSLLDSKGEPNQGGHFIRCEVTHEEVESNKTPGKMLKFVRLGDKESADGFDTMPAAPKTAAKPAQTTAPAAAPATGKPKAFDLGSLLG